MLETPDGPVFESNAIARYGKYYYRQCFLFSFFNPLVHVLGVYMS